MEKVFKNFVILHKACSSVRRILKRGGLFWKSEKCANDLDSNQTVCPKLEAKCLGKLGNSKLFSAQNQVISKKKKKKKGLRQNSEWFFGRNPKFKGFFCPKSGVLQNKKKGLYSRSVPFLTRTHSNFQPRAWCPIYKGGGPCLNFAHFTMQFCNPSDPKGGAMAQWFPP